MGWKAKRPIHFLGTLLKPQLFPCNLKFYGNEFSRPMLELCLPSSLDPTLSPPGCHVMSIFSQYTPYALSDGGWTDQRRQEYAGVGRYLTVVAM